MKSFVLVLNISAFTLMMSITSADNTLSKPNKNDHPPFRMFSEDMLEKGIGVMILKRIPAGLESKKVRYLLANV